MFELNKSRVKTREYVSSEFVDSYGNLTIDSVRLNDGHPVSTIDNQRCGKVVSLSNGVKEYYIKTFKGFHKTLLNPFTDNILVAHNPPDGRSVTCVYTKVKPETFNSYIRFLQFRNDRDFLYIERLINNGEA